jgi:hypothetical protein
VGEVGGDVGEQRGFSRSWWAFDGDERVGICASPEALLEGGILVKEIRGFSVDGIEFRFWEKFRWPGWEVAGLFKQFKDRFL